MVSEKPIVAKTATPTFPTVPLILLSHLMRFFLRARVTIDIEWGLDMAYEENTIREISIRMILGVSLALVLYLSTSTAWGASTTYVSMHALIAFLATSSWMLFVDRL